MKMLDVEWLQDEIDSTRRYMERLREQLVEAKAVQAAGGFAEPDKPAVGSVVETQPAAEQAAAIPTAPEPVAGPAVAVEVPVLDYDGYTVRWRSLSCPLGRSLSFRLAAALFTKPNEFVSVEALSDECWGADAAVSDEAVRTAVCRLRGWLRDDGMQDLAEQIVAKIGSYGWIPGCNENVTVQDDGCLKMGPVSNETGQQ